MLDDPDEHVFHTVEEVLLNESVSVVAELEKVEASSSSELLKQRIQYIVSHIKKNDIHQEIGKWLSFNQHDLFVGAYLVAKYEFPDLNYGVLSDRLGSIIDDVRASFSKDLNSFEKVQVLNNVFFKKHGFAKNNDDFYAPQNSYLNKVLDTATGNPVSLSVLYAIVARELGIPVYGVNLPKNFILCYVDVSSSKGSGLHKEITFYINPANAGTIIGKNDISHFLEQQNIIPLDRHFTPCSNKVIVRRMLVNLYHAYRKEGDAKKIGDIKELIDLFNKD